jgi:transcriptional regulator with XRE-family HTH domain
VDRTAAFDQVVGSNVRSRRRAKGVTQAELAGSLGLARTSITNVEAGRQPLSAWQLWRIAEVLETDLRGLLPQPLDLQSAHNGQRELPSDLTPKSRDVIRRLTASR